MGGAGIILNVAYVPGISEADVTHAEVISRTLCHLLHDLDLRADADSQMTSCGVYVECINGGIDTYENFALRIRIAVLYNIRS